MNIYERFNQERKLPDKRKKRVAAYCRVSTDKDDQANSFESQKLFFEQSINRNEDWELIEIFADEGITGTNTKKRTAFHRMIATAYSGGIDLILTKEVPRFARNTVDSLQYTRKLKEIGVGVIFLLDNINTLDSDGELRLSIMSSIAQEESRKTSERVKWGQKRQMEKGVVFGRSMLGYDVKGGQMFVNEDGARIVRLIFHKFVHEKKGTHVIARELREAGILPMRVKEWSNTVILRALRNEKYCGDLVQQKTYTPNYLTHEKKYNRGQEEFLILKDHHEPIISREMFEEAGRILDSRALSQEGKAKHSNRYPFSGKLKCAECGTSYVARYKKRKDGSQYKAWRCGKAQKQGSPRVDKAGNEVGCRGASVRNEDAVYIMYLVAKSLCYNRDKLANSLTNVIDAVIKQENPMDVPKLQEQIAGVEKKRAKLIDLYMSSDVTREEYSAARAKCDNEIRELENRVEQIRSKQTMQVERQSIMQKITAVVKELLDGVKYEDEFYKRLLEKMVVHDKDNIDVYINLLPLQWSYMAAKAAGAKVQKRNITDTDIGTEELGHFEMVATIVHQLTRNMTIEEVKRAGMEDYFVDHTAGIYTQSAGGIPWNAGGFAVKGDPIADLVEDLAAEQKASVTYDNILRLSDCPDVNNVIRFLREREIVHFQRFGEAIEKTRERLDAKNVYAVNPGFDKV